MDREGMWEMEERSRDLVACRVPHHNTAQEKERRRWERFGDKVSSVLLRRNEDGMHETTTDELAGVGFVEGERHGGERCEEGDARPAAPRLPASAASCVAALPPNA